jgi:hypothetical protein
VTYLLSGFTLVEGEKEREGTTEVIVSGSRQAEKELDDRPGFEEFCGLRKKMTRKETQRCSLSLSWRRK